MTGIIQAQALTLPDHTQLPESDGKFGKNFLEHPQSVLLSNSIEPILQQIHPDGQYCIGQDCGIYWRLTEPLEKGAEAPDWFYVPSVPPTLNGQMRRSYRERAHYPYLKAGVMGGKEWGFDAPYSLLSPTYLGYN